MSGFLRHGWRFRRAGLGHRRGFVCGDLQEDFRKSALVAGNVAVGLSITALPFLRSFAPQVTACPGCGRTTSTFFQHMAEDIQTYLREQMPVWKQSHPGVETMNVAVMGCVVNGPGESRHANIGISLPGTFEEPKAPVYVDGKLVTTLKGDHIVQEFLVILEDYVARTYPRASSSSATARSSSMIGASKPTSRSRS